MKGNKLRNIILTCLFVLLSLTVEIIAIPILLIMFMTKGIIYIVKNAQSNKKLVLSENEV